MTPVRLSGLSADNPLAALAALGALSLASDGLEGRVKLSWERGLRSWHPLVHPVDRLTSEDLVGAIVAAHERRDLREELGWTKDVMKLGREKVRTLLSARLADENVRAAEVVAACVSELPLRKNGLSSYTPLRLIPRRGRAGFVESAYKLSEPSPRTQEMIRNALFGPWEYKRGVNSLRWDPGAGLQARAYTAEAPTHMKPAGVPGAMLLAVRGLVFFPLMAAGRSARAPGIDERRRVVWPVWRDPLDEPAVRMLFRLPELYERRPRDEVLARHGV
ncbi:MAG: type I-G CRISPR-associated protein, Cas3-extension family, partial [Gaiellaceae bacterium]